MQTKKIIFSADDLGNGLEVNSGILKGVLSGIISSTCIMPNGAFYSQAVNEILPQFRNIGLGVHLDIIENKSLLNKNSKSLLCDISGRYNNSYQKLIKKSNDKNFLTEVEAEFRSQIESVLSVSKVDHLNSHVHTHAIPPIFELTCKLANEYGIKCVRSQYEKNYFLPQKSLNFNYPINLVKVGLLKGFSLVNRVTAHEYGIVTNDRFVGIRYTGFMDRESVLGGLSRVKDGQSVEVLIHPYFYETVKQKDKNRFGEYLLTQDGCLKTDIEVMGFEFGTYCDLVGHANCLKSHAKTQ